MNHRYKKWVPLLVVAMLLGLPVLTGVAVARRWPTIDDAYYGAVSQIIATLFIAIAVELFAPDKLVWDDRLDQFMVLSLIALSWSGLFGCARAMLGGGTAFTSGLAATGLMSASVLVSLALFARVTPTKTGPPAKLVFVFLVPPVLLLIVL